MVMTFAALAMGTSIGAATCEDPQSLQASIGAGESLVLRAASCAAGPDRHRVTLELLAGRDLVHRESFYAGGLAFSLAATTSLDIDGDGIPDVGVANGAGRAGDGMMYWLLKRRPYRLLPVGEAPLLALTADGRSVPYALIPGSDDVIATRMEYAVTQGKLHPTRSLMFAPLESGEWELREAIPTDTDGEWISRRSIRAAPERLRSCMEGGVCP